VPRHLPPLNALRAFEAAARHLSFSQAAEELSVTQSAISKQVSLLESHLEVILFERQASRVRLTKQGATYLPSVTAAFDTLAEATREVAIKRGGQQTLNLDVIPSFASLWLIPRLQGFHQAHSNIEVELTAGDGPIQFANSKADLAIRCLPAHLAQGSARLLFKEKLLLVATNDFLTDNPISKPKDLLQQRVIPQTTRPALWDQFLEAQGYKRHNLQFAIRSEHFFISLQSVMASLGLGLLPDFLIQQQLQSGQLCHVMQLSYHTDYGYFALSPGYKTNLHKVQRFVNWLEMQISV